MTKFILDAMYYQIFIFNRDKFILENPHERTIQIICGILFLPVIVFRISKQPKITRNIQA